MLDAALIGLGWWGKTIVQMLEASTKLRLVKVVDVSAAAGDWARQRGLPYAADYAEALADPNVKAVILATPHTQHTQQIVRAAGAGKHVFCEKPLALSRRDAAASVAACNAAGVVLAVGHERRFEPPMIELKRLAAAGELGKLLQIEASFCQDLFLSLPADNWRLDGREAPAGPMTATGIHLLDLSVGLLGPAECAYARARQLGSQLANGDTLGALIGFKSGANALITAVLATPFIGRFALYGSEGWAEVIDKAHPQTPEGWTLVNCRRGGRPERIEYPPAPAVRANLEAFAVAALGGASYPVPQAEMIANIAALEAIFKSAAGGRAEAVEG